MKRRPLILKIIFPSLLSVIRSTHWYPWGIQRPFYTYIFIHIYIYIYICMFGTLSTIFCDHLIDMCSAIQQGCPPLLSPMYRMWRGLPLDPFQKNIIRPKQCFILSPYMLASISSLLCRICPVSQYVLYIPIYYISSKPQYFWPDKLKIRFANKWET